MTKHVLLQSSDLTNTTPSLPTNTIHFNIATILDPRMNLGVYGHLLPGANNQTLCNRARAQFLSAFLRARQLQLAEAENSKETDNHEPDSDDELFVLRNKATGGKWSRFFLEQGIGEKVDFLKWWQAKQYSPPVLALLARDYLAIPQTPTRIPTCATLKQSRIEKW